MLTSLFVNHFPQNLFDILVGGLYSSVHLGAISSWLSMNNLKYFTYLYHQVTVEICTIISNDGLWYSKPTHQIIANKVCYNFLDYQLKRSCFYPLGEIVNGNKNKFVFQWHPCTMVQMDKVSSYSWVREAALGSNHCALYIYEISAQTFSNHAP